MRNRQREAAGDRKTETATVPHSKHNYKKLNQMLACACMHACMRVKRVCTCLHACSLHVCLPAVDMRWRIRQENHVLAV